MIGRIKQIPLIAPIKGLQVLVYDEGKFVGFGLIEEVKPNSAVWVKSGEGAKVPIDWMYAKGDLGILAIIYEEPHRSGIQNPLYNSRRGVMLEYGQWQEVLDKELMDADADVSFTIHESSLVVETGDPARPTEFMKVGAMTGYVKPEKAGTVTYTEEEVYETLAKYWYENVYKNLPEEWKDDSRREFNQWFNENKKK